MNAVLFGIANLICLIGIGVLQFQAFGSATKSRTHNNVVSFFYIREISETWIWRSLAVVAATPLSFIFFVISWNAETFGKAILKEYAEYYKNHMIGTIPVSPNMLDSIPDPLYPFIILLVCFFVFGAQLKFLYNRIEKGVLFASGISFRTNKISMDFATALLNLREYNHVIACLEEYRQKKIPLPEELEESSDELKLSFQLLHVSKTHVANMGLRVSLMDIVERAFVDVLNHQEFGELKETIEAERQFPFLLNTDVNWFHLCSGLMIYLIVCGLYVGIAPMAGGSIAENLSIVWPEYDQIDSLVSGVALMSFATILPMIVGIIFYSTRVTSVSETPVQTLLVVFTLVFVLSFVPNFLVVFLQRAEFLIGMLKGDAQEFAGVPEAVYVLVHSVVPCLAVVAIAVADPQKILSRLDFGLAIGVVSGGHLLGYLAFEMVAGREWGYYWHQALQGVVLSVAALLTLRVFWRPPKGPQKVFGSVRVGGDGGSSVSAEP